MSLTEKQPSPTNGESDKNHSPSASEGLPWFEKAGLALLVIAGVMMLLEMPAREILMLSLGTISTVFFLNAYAPPKVRSENPGA